jgi:hypothetical protein
MKNDLLRGFCLTVFLVKKKIVSNPTGSLRGEAGQGQIEIEQIEYHTYS